MPKEVDSFGISDIKKNERRSNRDVVNDPKNHRSGEFGQLVNKQQKVQTKESKARVSKNGKVVTNIAPTDLNHQSINEHLKITYFNINTIPQDLLRQLAPQNFLLQKQSESKSKSKEEKKENKTKKDQEKPFKRQAYHIGIAYHLHIKQVKNKP